MLKKLILLSWIVIGCLSCTDKKQNSFLEDIIEASANIEKPKINSTNIPAYNGNMELQKINFEPYDVEYSFEDLFQIENLFYLDDNASVNEISKLVMEDDRIYILDSRYKKSLYCFEKDGTLTWQFNANDYQLNEINDFYINPAREEIAILTFKGILKLDLDGNFISNDYLGVFGPNFALVPNSDRAIIATSRASFFADQLYKLITINSDHEIDGFNLPFTEKELEIRLKPRHFFSPSYKDEILYYEYFNDTIYGITESNIFPKYQLNQRGGNQIAYLKSQAELGKTEFEGSYFKGYNYVFETDDFLIMGIEFGHRGDVYFNKNLNTSIFPYKKSIRFKDSNMLFIPKILFADQEHIYCVLYPEQIHRLLKNKYGDDYKNKASSQKEIYHQIVTQTKENSKPVIVKIKIKDELFKA